MMFAPCSCADGLYTLKAGSYVLACPQDWAVSVMGTPFWAMICSPYKSAEYALNVPAHVLSSQLKGFARMPLFCIRPITRPEI